jgi:hypothetical protein
MMLDEGVVETNSIPLFDQEIGLFFLPLPGVLYHFANLREQTLNSVTVTLEIIFGASDRVPER